MSHEWAPWSRANVILDPKLDAVRSIIGANGTVHLSNGVYDVAVRESSEAGGWPAHAHLSIKSRDRDTMLPWAHLQRIKSEVVNPGADGVELFPAESRLVDTSNQFHLFVFDPAALIPIGIGPVGTYPKAPRIVTPKKLDVLAKSKSRYSPPTWTRFTQVRVDLSKAAPSDRPDRPVAGVFINSRYEVWAFQWGTKEQPTFSLSIRRHDGYHWRDWRDLQRIKNEILGAEQEAVDLFPDIAREHDIEQFDWILWSLPRNARFPFGYEERLVAETLPEGTAAKQRPWEDDARPSDLKDMAEHIDGIIRSSSEKPDSPMSDDVA